MQQTNRIEAEKASQSAKQRFTRWHVAFYVACLLTMLALYLAFLRPSPEERIATWTAEFDTAVAKGDLKVVSRLVTKIPRPTNYQLSEAISNKNTLNQAEIVEVMLLHGAPIENLLCDALLMHAGPTPDIRIVKLLLKHGADPDGQCGYRSMLNVAKGYGDRHGDWASFEAIKAVAKRPDINFAAEDAAADARVAKQNAEEAAKPSCWSLSLYAKGKGHDMFERAEIVQSAKRQGLCRDN